VADAGAFDEFRERDAFEHAASVFGDVHPDLLQYAVALAVIGVFVHRELRAFNRAHDVRQRDVLGRAREHVTAAHAALGTHQARAFDREEDLLEIGLREVRALGDFLDRRGSIGPVERQRQERSGRIIPTSRHFHGSMLA
jgi:hypothetical protein